MLSVCNEEVQLGIGSYSIKFPETHLHIQETTTDSPLCMHSAYLIKTRSCRVQVFIPGASCTDRRMTCPRSYYRVAMIILYRCTHEPPVISTLPSQLPLSCTNFPTYNEKNIL